MAPTPGLLEYRSFGLSGEDADICIDLIEGFLQVPDVRGRDWIAPRLDGRTEGNRRKDVMIIPAAGFIRGSGSGADERRADFLVNLTAVMAVMDPSLTPGALVLSDGYLGLSSGVEATIQVRVRNASPGKMQSGQAFQLWSFEFEAIDPEWTFGS